jgi:hypothetical protein
MVTAKLKAVDIMIMKVFFIVFNYLRESSMSLVQLRKNVSCRNKLSMDAKSSLDDAWYE